jgi:hypothetical protein
MADEQAPANIDNIIQPDEVSSLSLFFLLLLCSVHRSNLEAVLVAAEANGALLPYSYGTMAWTTRWVAFCDGVRRGDGSAN